MRTSRLAGVGLVLSIALGLAACTGTAEPKPTPTTAPSDVTDITDQPGSVEGWVGALEDAKTTTCARDGGNWVAAGTVTNPLDEAQSYRLYVSAMFGGETRGLIQVDVPDVAGGESGQWRAAFPLQGDEFTCVLRVERFAPTP